VLDLLPQLWYNKRKEREKKYGIKRNKND
jgi:hypothetical protein